MSIRAFLKVIGRGTKGAGDLDREQAKILFSMILKGEVSDLELGAFCLAMRFKGEAVSELMGFMDALESHLCLIDTGGRPTIVLPSFNGARKQANLTPLLAGLLAQQGWTVIVQGIEKDPNRITSHAVFKELSWPILESLSECEHSLKTRLPIFCPTRILSPALHQLLEVREQLGLRNSAHVLAKLLNPIGSASWLVSNYTHPDYAEKLKSYFQAREVNAILMRGNEGEPTASLQRLPAMHFHFADGNQKASDEERFAEDNPFGSIDAVSTSRLTQDILDGSLSCPSSIARQVVQFSQLLV